MNGLCLCKKVETSGRKWDARRKKSPYSELFSSAFFPDFPAFGVNMGKSGKNANQNNSEYGLFLHNDVKKLKFSKDYEPWIVH